MTEDTYPLISVYVLLYNEKEEWVRQSLFSVLQQTYPNVELIVVLDNPNNVEALRVLDDISQLDNVRISINESNKGITYSRNKAVNMCAGEYIACLDGDDVATPERLEMTYQAILDRELDIVGGWIEMLESKKVMQFPVNTKYCKKMMSICNCIPHSTWLVKKSVYQELQGYRNIDSVEDYDFLIRAILKGYKVGNIPAVMASYREHEDSDSHLKESKQHVLFIKIANAYKKQEVISESNLAQYCETKSFEKKVNRVDQFYILEKKRKEKTLIGHDWLCLFVNFEYYRKLYRYLAKKRILVMDQKSQGKS